MLEKGISYNHVVFFTEVTQCLSLIIDITYAVFPHHMLSATVVVSQSGIQVSHHISRSCAGTSSATACT